MRWSGRALHALGRAVLGAVCVFAGSLPVSAQEAVCSSPDVIFCEDYERTDWASRWGEVSHPTRKTRDTDTRNVFSGQASLRVAFPPGDQDGGGWMIYWWNAPIGQGTVYIRYHMKFQTGFNWGGWDVKMAGLAGRLPGVRYGPSAGTRPDGTWFDALPLALGVPNGSAQPRQPLFYYYHMNQQSQWGDFAHQNVNLPATVFETDRWYCVEMMVRPNDIGSANGEMSMWIDDVLKGRYTGISWRNRSDVEMNKLNWTAWIGEPQHSTTQYRWEDNLVVSRSRIGCSATGSTAPAPPRNLRVVG